MLRGYLLRSVPTFMVYKASVYSIRTVRTCCRVTMRGNYGDGFLRSLGLTVRSFGTFRYRRPRGIGVPSWVVRRDGRLRGLCKFVRTFVCVAIYVRVLLFIRFPFDRRVVPLLSGVTGVPVCSGVLCDGLFAFFVVVIAYVKAHSGGSLRLSPAGRVVFPLVFKFVVFFKDVYFLFFGRGKRADLR